MKKQLLTICLLACLSAFAAVVKDEDAISITLQPGWNLVTLSRSVTSDAITTFLALKPMRLSDNKQSLVQCKNASEVKIGAGYWIYSTTTKSVSLPFDQSQTSWTTVGLTSGWNLIGNASKSTWQSKATTIWQWLNGAYQPTSSGELTLGKGYWAK